MNIPEWLRDLGLDEYASAFRDNHIDPQLLLSLTARDLKEIGVASVGHRRKIFDAMENCGSRLSIQRVPRWLRVNLETRRWVRQSVKWNADS